MQIAVMMRQIFTVIEKSFISNFHLNKNVLSFVILICFTQQAVNVNAKGELYELFMCLYLRLKHSKSLENLQTFVVLSIDSIIIPIFTQNRNNVQFGFLLKLFVKMNLHQSL